MVTARSRETRRAVVVTLERHQRPGRVDRDARRPGGQEVTRQQADRRPHLEQRVGCPVVAGPGLDGAAGSQLEHQRAARDLDLVTGVDDVAVVERLGGAVGPHHRGDPVRVYAHRRSGAGLTAEQVRADRHQRRRPGRSSSATTALGAVRFTPVPPAVSAPRPAAPS